MHHHAGAESQWEAVMRTETVNAPIVPVWCRGLLNVREAAAVAGCSQPTIRKAIAAGHIRLHPHFTEKRLSRAELDRWMDMCVSLPQGVVITALMTEIKRAERARSGEGPPRS